MVGQEPFGYFGLGRHSGFSKVTRRQGGTLGGRYLNNGYVPSPTVLTVRPSSQASQLPHWIAVPELNPSTAIELGNGGLWCFYTRGLRRCFRGQLRQCGLAEQGAGVHVKPGLAQAGDKVHCQ